MLVVTRKRNEAIVIGDGIEVRVLRVGSDGVRLGISAPSDIAVHRREIYDLIRAANESAATGPAALGSLLQQLRTDKTPAAAAAADKAPAASDKAPVTDTAPAAAAKGR